MMTQEIVHDFPPLFDEIRRAFPVQGRDVLYSFGPRLFNPHGVIVPPELVAHEAVHGERQGAQQSFILDWWRRYLEDPAFRLAEEAAAHRAEYRYLREHGVRSQRRRALKQVAAKLADPLYGSLVTRQKAQHLLRS